MTAELSCTSETFGASDVRQCLVPMHNSAETPSQRSDPQKIVLLGATGSIGSSTLELIRKYPGRFRLVGVSCGSNVERLQEIIEEFRPEAAAVADESQYAKLSAALSGGSELRLLAGHAALEELAGDSSADTVVGAVVGMAGLPSIVAALRAGKRVALANKESLVAGGSVVTKALREGGGELLPVDSEHSALYQAMVGNRYSDIRRLILTASGGPFLDRSSDDFSLITPEEAVRHPNWSMGQKISVDSATLMNKALELIEAHWLFGFPEESIEVLVHPQSIVHSLVEYVDGSYLAQLSVPDMKGAIGYALGHGGGRLPGSVSSLDWMRNGRLDFSPLDDQKFPSVSIARQCLQAGGTHALVLNVANEIAVAAFLSKRLKFDRIFAFCASALTLGRGTPPASLEEVLEIEREIRARLLERLESFG